MPQKKNLKTASYRKFIQSGIPQVFLGYNKKTPDAFKRARGQTYGQVAQAINLNLHKRI